MSSSNSCNLWRLLLFKLQTNDDHCHQPLNVASALLPRRKTCAQATQKCQSIWTLQNSQKQYDTGLACMWNYKHYQYSSVSDICKVYVVLLCPVTLFLACPVCLSRGVVIQHQTFRRFIRSRTDWLWNTLCEDGQLTALTLIINVYQTIYWWEVPINFFFKYFQLFTMFLRTPELDLKILIFYYVIKY